MRAAGCGLRAAGCGPWPWGHLATKVLIRRRDRLLGTHKLRTGLAEVHGPPVTTKLRAAAHAYETAITEPPEQPASPPDHHDRT